MSLFDKIMKFAQGRTTAFAAFFAASATILEWFGHLSMNYVAAIGAIQALVLAHSTKEDYFEKKQEN
jgi:hypothetical protein